MRVLVTGGAGFIGSHFACYALGSGHSIINIDKLTYAGCLENLESYQHHPEHVFYQEDICNGSFLSNILFKHQPDSIVHMAAESHVDRSIDCADDFIRTNIMGTQVLLEASLKYYQSSKCPAEFRFIHLSTDEVFGSLGKDGHFNETMPYRPNSPYAASKASSDLLVRAYHKTYGLPTIIVNSSNNYGPKQYPEKLIPLTILNALEGKPLPLYGNGQQVRDWLYVEDHIEALWAVIQRGYIGESYCVGGNQELTNLDLVHLICDILEEVRPSRQRYKELITFVADRPGHDQRYATDITKVKNHTGWEPRTKIDEGLEKTIKWYAQHCSTLCLNEQARVRMGVAHAN